MTTPENAGTISRQELVQRVLNRSLLKGWPLSEHGEEDDGYREKIDTLPRVTLLQVELGCHIGDCSALGLENTGAISAIYRPGEAKIGHFEPALRIEHQIFWLKVAVCNAPEVHKVEGLEQLLKEVPGRRLRKSTP